MRFTSLSLGRVRRSLWILALGLVFSLPSFAQNEPLDRRAAIEEIYPVMIASLEAKNYGRARNLCEQVILWEPQNPVHHYNLACIEAQTGGPRLAYALGALELSIALGFNEADHMQADPDLVPLRTHPRFPELVRKVMLNATASEALSSLAVPPAAERPRETPPSDESVEKPARSSLAKGVPIGLYYMSRYHSEKRTLEQGVWYFSPEGTVYRNLGSGFSSADLSAHAGPKGTAALNDTKLEITWTGGGKNVADLDQDPPDFTWDMAIFTPVAAFQNPGDVVGIYQGGDGGSLSGNKLELRDNGTFVWEGGGLADTGLSPKVGAAALASIKGTWELRGLSLTLTNEQGARFRRLAFPSDDDKTVIKPDRMFFDGAMYRKLP